MMTISCSRLEVPAIARGSGANKTIEVPLKAHYGPVDVKRRQIDLVLNEEEAMKLAVDLLGCVSISTIEQVKKEERYGKLLNMLKEI